VSAAAAEAQETARAEKESADRRNRDLKHELKLARDEASVRNKAAAARMSEQMVTAAEHKSEQMVSDLSDERDEMAEHVETERRLKNGQAQRAREAEKTCAVQQKLADSRYEKLKALEDEVSDLKSRLDEAHEQLETSTPQRSPPASSPPLVSSVSSEALSILAGAKSEGGRFGKHTWQIRCQAPLPLRRAAQSTAPPSLTLRSPPHARRALCWAQLARRTPPSAIAGNIVDTVKMLMPLGTKIKLPSLDLLRKMRGEMTIAGETMAEMRIADCHHVMSFGFDESSKKQERPTPLPQLPGTARI
jgi:hypothetical protein